MLKCYLPILYLLLTWFPYISGVPPRTPQPKKKSDGSIHGFSRIDKRY